MPICSVCSLLSLSPRWSGRGCEPMARADLSGAQGGHLAPGGGELSPWPVDAALLVPQHPHHGLHGELALAGAGPQQLCAAPPPDWSEVIIMASDWSTAPGIWAGEGALSPAPHHLAPVEGCLSVPPAPGPGRLLQAITAQVNPGGHAASQSLQSRITSHASHVTSLTSGSWRCSSRRCSPSPPPRLCRLSRGPRPRSCPLSGRSCGS